MYYWGCPDSAHLMLLPFIFIIKLSLSLNKEIEISSFFSMGKNVETFFNLSYKITKNGYEINDSINIGTNKNIICISSNNFVVYPFTP